MADPTTPCKHFDAMGKFCAYMKLPTEARGLPKREGEGLDATVQMEIYCARQFMGWLRGSQTPAPACEIPDIEARPYPAGEFSKQRDLVAAASMTLNAIAVHDNCPQLRTSNTMGPLCKTQGELDPCLCVGTHTKCPVNKIVREAERDSRQVGPSDEMLIKDAYTEMLSQALGVTVVSDVDDDERRFVQERLAASR